MKNGRCYIHGGKSTGVKKSHRGIKHGMRTEESEMLHRDKQLNTEFKKIN